MTNVYPLLGGMQGWKEAGLPMDQLKGGCARFRRTCSPDDPGRLRQSNGDPQGPIR